MWIILELGLGQRELCEPFPKVSAGVLIDKSKTTVSCASLLEGVYHESRDDFPL